jgi:hypothetical protein
MNKEHAVLVASLLLNAGLIAFLAVPAATVPIQVPAGGYHKGVTAPDAKNTQPLDVGATTTRPGTDETLPAATSSERARAGQSVRELVAELRRRGVDEGTVRRLGVAHAERQFRLEARALLSPREKLGYWQAPTDLYSFGHLDPTKLREFQRLRRARIDTLEDLFGNVDAEATEHNSVHHYVSDYSARQFEYAPTEKRLALTELFERDLVGVGRTPVERLLSQHRRSPVRELDYADKAREILGPDLFDEYLLKSSAAAWRLKHELATMQPTRAEFDQLVRAEYEMMREKSETIASLRPGPGGSVADSADARKLEEARSEVVREVLGDARYAEYERATDPAFRHLEMLARELGLGTPAARSAFAHVERARTKVGALFPEGGNGDPRAMDEFRKIRNETRERIAEDLGLQGLSDSEQQGVLGPALYIHPQQTAQRMFRWF